MNPITRLGLLTTAGAIFALSSCATGGKSPSGFLSNYQQLNSGFGTEDAVTSYRKPDVDLKKYDSVLIEPVTTVVASPGISPSVSEQLAAYLSEALSTQLATRMKVVTTPGPTTLRVRTALTDVIEGREAGKPVTTVHVGARATLTGTIGSEPVAAFVSHVSFEGELLDSQSGERLVALIDHRLGVKREASASTSWGGVRSGLNQAVVRLRERFLTARSN